jgi:hypothetical protein
MPRSIGDSQAPRSEAAGSASEAPGHAACRAIANSGSRFPDGIAGSHTLHHGGAHGGIRDEEVIIMSVKLNRRGLDHAKALVEKGRIVVDERDAWSEHQPSTRRENEFIREHGYAEYGRWHLGIDDDQSEETKARYKFPYGDFKDVHRCAVLSAESRAGQYKYFDIESAAAHLHGMIDASVTHAR